MCAIAYLPSVNALRTLMDTAPGRPRSPCVVGAHFTDEAQRVAELLDARLRIIGEHLDRRQLLDHLFDCDLLHMSAQGFFDARDPGGSGLILAWSTELSRYLEARATAHGHGVGRTWR